MKTAEKIVGVLFGVPTIGRPICPEMLFAVASTTAPINFHVNTSMPWGHEVADARNLLVEQAKEINASFIFMMGDDTQPPGHALKQFIYRMEHQADLGVVGGVYCSKTNPPAPLVFRGNGKGSYWDWKAGEYFEVSGLGMDCILIRTAVFEDLEPPYFKTIKTDGFLDGIAKSEAWTEDLWFCDRVLKETKWKIYCDSMVMARHWQHMGGNRWEYFTLRDDSKPFLREPQKKNQKQILDLGCGMEWFDFNGEGHVTRCDVREICSPDYRIDIRRLPFDAESFDVVFSSHTLEHFARAEVAEMLKEEWLRVLKPGGELRLIIPDLKWAAEKINEGIVNEHVLNVLYGSQEYSENFHKCGFTEETLTAMLKKLGICRIEIAHQGYNIFLTGKKRKPRRHAKRSVKRKSSG